MTEPVQTFVAFISYSHKDAAWATWVQREIERYRLPAAFAKEKALPKRLGKVFRDREELSTGQNLGDHLTAALEQSQNLIVICSPNAVQSQWVSQEIEYFKNLGRGDRIFALLVEGGAESLPQPLLTDIQGNALEPLAADPRKDADGRRLAKLKLIAGMLETNLDQLAQRERARRQQLLFSYAGLANLFLMAIGAALYFDQQRQYEAEQKARERELGIENVVSMTDFVKLTRQYYDKGALEYVSDEFSSYLERFDDSELTTNQQAAKADALRVVGEASYDLGDVGKALKAYEESRELYYSASRAKPENVDLAIETAFSDFYVGVTHFYEGNLTSAKQPLERYADQISSLFAENPSHPILLSESIAAPTAVLTLLVELSYSMNNELENQIGKTISAVDTAMTVAPGNIEILYLSQGPMDYAAHAHMKSCEVDNAFPYRKRAVEYARRALELDPRNRQYKTNLANALFAYAGMLALNYQPFSSVENYVAARRLQTDLLSEDPENQYLKSRLLNTDIELLATITFYRETQQELTVDEILSITALEAEVGTNTMLDFYLMVRGVAENNPELIQKSLTELTFALEAEDPDNERVKLALILQRLAERSLETTFVSNLPSSVGGKSNSESCNARLINWAEQELNGNFPSADKILDEAKTLGLKGMALGFYSELLRAQRQTLASP
ncbi:MAG: TIR domain-containing protein [Gammaproteobacteria bacterium]|nr:TIR domain-containing protein [Gammaproteobacteria bacterium]